MDIGDIDTINKTIKVVKGKGKKDRYILIPNELIHEIRGYIQDKREGSLFTLSDRHIRRIVKQYARAAGIRRAEEVHPHTLRHSYATHLQNQRVREHIERAFKDFGHET